MTPGTLGPLQGRAATLLIELWGRVRVDWGFLSDRLADSFRRERSLGSRERRQVAEAIYAVTRQARRIDFALEGAGPGRRGEALAALELWAHFVLTGEATIEAAHAAFPDYDWAKVAAVESKINRERDLVRRLGLARSLPDWLVGRLIDERGPVEADALATALGERAPLTIRVNRLKSDRAATIARLAAEGIEARPTRFSPDGLVLETRTNVFGLAAFKEGLFEVQDEASQLVAELVLPNRGLVIDACAGAGGKTLALGALMGSRGRLVALDIHERKLEELRKRARRAGLSNARAIEIEETSFPGEVEALYGKADRVLVDAPCSGIGALRRNPEARWRLGEDDVARFPALQLAILKRCAPLVAPNGRLIYATCTVLAAENQEVVERFLAEVPGFTPVRPAEILGAERAFGLTDASDHALEMLPHRHGTDGFFAIVLRRAGA